MCSPSAFARRRIGEPEVPAWFAITSLKGSPPEVWNDISDGPLHIKFELPKKVSWDQKKLGDIAAHIVAAGDKVEHFIDVKLAVSESRFTNWPPTLQQEFAAARTVEPGKPSFTLSLDSELLLSA
jgi:hypothetical protein